MSLRIPIEFVNKFKPDLEQQLKQEIIALQSGDIDGASLIKSMMHDLSFEQYQKLVVSKGQNRDTILSIAEVSVEIQKASIIAIVQTVVGIDLADRTIAYARDALKRIRELEKIDKDEADPFLDKLYTDAKEDITELARNVRKWHENQVRKMFD